MKRVTLSFDNGPSAEVTPGVLDCLAARGIAATFLVSAKDILDETQRALVRRARSARPRRCWPNSRRQTASTGLTAAAA